MPISHIPAVPVGNFSDGIAFIWTGFLLNLAGIYPLFVFLSTLSDPRHMNTLGAWLLVSLALIGGIIAGACGLKEKGYQQDHVRFLAIGSLSVGILFCCIPLAASVMYAFGIGN